MANTERIRKAAPTSLALSLVAALIMALGLCPAFALASEIEVVPEGSEGSVVVAQSEVSTDEPEPEGQPVEEGEPVVSVQDLETASNVSYSYLYYASEGDARNGKTTSGSHDCTKVENSATASDVIWSTTSNEGWYVVEGEKTIKGLIEVTGDVHLILADGAKLIGHGGIVLSLGKSLTIYAQSTDKNSMGAMEITHPTDDAGSAILGQKLTINGGRLSFTGHNTYGIFLCANGSDPIRDARLTINGGEVTANGGIQVLSSLGDANNINASLTINGGTVIADGGYYGLLAWDDGGNGRAKATINGGTVTAFGEDGAIGTKGGTLTIGEGVTVKAGESEGSAANIPAQDFQTDHTQTWAQTTVPVTGVTVTPASTTLTVGDTSTLTATIKPDHAVVKGVAWTSSNAGVATVDEKTGEVTAVAVGTATITATANDGSGKSASCAVTVKAKPTPVSIPDASVVAHVQRIGWMVPVTDGTAAGTTGKSRRLEALTLRLPEGVSGGIEYRGHVQRSGWEETWATDGATSGTTGKSRRMEAVQIQLTGAAKDAYDVYYRVHVQRLGWMAWAKNGEEAGTTGMSRRAEAIQVVLVKKDAPAPEATYKGVTQNYAKAFVKK